MFVPHYTKNHTNGVPTFLFPAVQTAKPVRPLNQHFRTQACSRFISNQSAILVNKSNLRVFLHSLDSKFGLQSSSCRNGTRPWGSLQRSTRVISTDFQSAADLCYSQRVSRRRYFSAFFGILLVATLLRCTGITFDSLWLDEGYQSLVGACGHGQPDLLSPRKEPFLFRFEKPASADRMLRHFREVDPLCPPLYSLTLNRWMSYFGDSDAAIRSLSVVASVLSVLSVTILGTIVLGPQAGLLSGAIMAVSPYDVHYAQEARMYGFVSLFSALSCGSLLVYIGTKCGWQLFWDPGKNKAGERFSWIWLIAYALASWALINSHYTGLFILLAQGLCSTLFLLVTRQWRLYWQLCLAWLGIAVLWLPWLPMFFQSASIRKESFYVAREPSFSWPFYALLLRIPVNWETFLAGNRVVAWAAPLYATSAIFLLSSFQALFVERRHRYVVRYLWLWAWIPAVALWFLDSLENHRVVEISRYTIGILPAATLLAGYGLSRLIGMNRKFLWLAVIHAIFALVNLVYTHTVHQREPWREMAAALEERWHPHDLVVVSEYYNIALLDRYLTKPYRQIGASPAMGADAIAKILAGEKKFALVMAQKGDDLAGMIPEGFVVKDQVDFSHALHLKIYEKP